jgi:hypothetical protein
MKERPILFSGPMVRAILEGRKTQTRRVVKPQPTWSVAPLEFTNAPGHWAPNEAEDVRRFPYGVPGDLLWVRESWQLVCPCPGGGKMTCLYEDVDGAEVIYAATVADGEHPPRWRPSIHMPRRLSRLTLEIVSVRVERVQDISEADAKAEGFPTFAEGGADATAADNFLSTFYDLNKRATRDANPWVWVVEFRTQNPGRGRKE